MGRPRTAQGNEGDRGLLGTQGVPAIISLAAKASGTSPAAKASGIAAAGLRHASAMLRLIGVYLCRRI
jgi:hypothetical protein